MSTDTARTVTPAEQRYYVSGPLDPTALAEALRAVYGVLRARLDHDVYTALYDAGHAADGRFQAPEYRQIARAVLYAIVGIGALEVRDPLRALQLWQARNTGTTLAWALGEAVSLISHEDRIAVAQDRAEQRSAAVESGDPSRV